MKIQKAEFKAIIKECLKELVAEGALDHMVANTLAERSTVLQQQSVMQDPRIKMAAAGNPIMEQIFADTAVTSLPQQQQGILPNGMALPAGVNLGMLGENYPSSPSFGYVPQGRNPLPPRDPQAVAALQQMAQPQAPASTWARLAFNSPISNRPGGQRGMTGEGHLPGSRKGSFE
jgi:hypothetical protein